MIVGATALTLILRGFVSLPAEFDALTVKLKVPIIVFCNIPEMTPVGLSFNPYGRLPLTIVHVIGLVPLALRV